MSDETDTTHYDLLGVTPSASKNEVKAAYQSALDAARDAGDTEQESEIRRAWQVLSDPVQRQRYDERIGVGRRNVAEPVRRVDEPTGADVEEDADEHEHVDADAVEVLGEAEPDSRPHVGHLPVGAPAFLEQPTLGRRMVASFIDGITLLALVAATFAIVFAVTSSDSARAIALVASFEVWIVVLFVIPTGRTGQTLGKRFTYIMCVDRSTGELLSSLQVIGRYALPMFAVPILGQLGPFLALFYGLSYAMARDQISLADRLGRSIVVVARYRPTRAR